MPTKAQAFRTEQMRNAHPPKPKQPKRPRRDLIVDTALPGVSADDRSIERGPIRSNLAGHRGGAALEDIAPGARPSRKSTRKSADHTKRTTNLQLKASRATAAPTAQATRPAASTTRVRASQSKATKPVAKRAAPAAGRRGR